MNIVARTSGSALSAAFHGLSALMHPISGLVVWGALAVSGALRAEGPLGGASLFAAVVGCVLAAASLPGMIAGMRERVGQERIPALHTNASAFARTILQVVVVACLMLDGGPTAIGASCLAVLLALSAWDTWSRASFVARVRRAGGVEALAARRVAEIVREFDHPHERIARENARGRDASQLHWRYGIALSDENVKLYELERSKS